MGIPCPPGIVPALCDMRLVWGFCPDLQALGLILRGQLWGGCCRQRDGSAQPSRNQGAHLLGSQGEVARVAHVLLKGIWCGAQVLCWRQVTFGKHGCQLPPSSGPHPDPQERCAVFAAALLEGRVLPAMQGV